jgi:hypothetical protein
MNIQVFTSAIDNFNDGNIKFNLGSNWSFLYNNHWCPTRSFMITYSKQLGENKDYNLHQAVFELSKFIPITSADISYESHLPVLNVIINLES